MEPMHAGVEYRVETPRLHHFTRCSIPSYLSSPMQFIITVIKIEQYAYYEKKPLWKWDCNISLSTSALEHNANAEKLTIGNSLNNQTCALLY